MVLLIGCQKKDEKVLIIAEQYGLAYAPLQVMKLSKTLEEALPEYQIKWVKLPNTTAIREAITAGQLDVGFLGIPPFIIGYDKKIPWKMFTGLSQAPLGLMGREGIKFEDIDKGRIALPQPGSIQHILLAMAAERYFSDAKYFDDSLVTLSHPDGMQALLRGREVDYHFTSPPYIFEEKNQGFHEIISGEECMGEPFTFIVGVSTKEFFHDQDAYHAFMKGLQSSLELMADDPETTLALLVDAYDYDLKTLETYLYESGIIYGDEILGVDMFVDFMYRNHYIDDLYEKDVLIWQND
jgi:NitT/TauT family transport system substrate-binding protein